MKVLESLAEGVNNPADFQALADQISGDFEISFRIARKVIASKGRKGAAFCVIYGKLGSERIPWVIIDKTAGKAFARLKRARTTIKAFPGLGGKDIFFRGSRFCRGTVAFDPTSRRLVFSLDEGQGTLSPSLLTKCFDRPAKGFRQDPKSAVKKLTLLLRQALVYEGEAPVEIDAAVATDPEGLLDEIFEMSDEDKEDLESFVASSDHPDWGALWQSEADELRWMEEEATTTATDLLLDKLLSETTDGRERARLWLEYRRVSPLQAKKLVVGQVLTGVELLERQQALLAERYGLRRRARFVLEQREELLSQLERLLSEPSVGESERRQRFAGLRVRFEELGERYRELSQLLDRVDASYETLTLSRGEHR